MSVALVAALSALSLSAVTAASAADISHSPPSSTMSTPASDTLNLSSSQPKTGWNDLHSQALHSQATKQTPPAGFSATTGSVVPSTEKTSPSLKTARDVPSLKSYDFAVIQGKVLIVTPLTRKLLTSSAVRLRQEARRGIRRFFSYKCSPPCMVWRKNLRAPVCFLASVV